MDFTIKERYQFEDLLKIMEILRSENGCMWDRAQDHHSIRRNFIEETYEVCEAIDNEDVDLLREELGDVLLQVVFHTRIEEEKGTFNIDDVADGICKKLIYRHPHIFGSVDVASTEEILNNWDALKKVEKGQKSTTDTLNSVARSLPALIRAEKVQYKVAKVGFVILCRHPAPDKYLGILFHVTAVILIISRKYDHFHTAQEIFNGQKSHYLIIFCVFYGFFCDQTADDLDGTVHNRRLSRLLIRLKLRRNC